MKVDLLSFQNHPCLLNLVRIETLEKQLCVHGALVLQHAQGELVPRRIQERQYNETTSYPSKST